MPATPLDDVALLAVLEAKGYDLIRKIGSGVSGHVCLIFSRKYHTNFAVKVISRHAHQICSDCEVNALRELTSQYVISLYDAVVSPDCLYCFFEYCPYGSLEDYVGQTCPLAGGQLYAVCKAVLTGLAYIHSQRWAHLDLKPANILIDHYGRPKLADFGFSRLFPGSALTDQHAGSIAFMAPEIFHSRSFDPFKADIWAAAVTFFWISSGETPWTQRQMPEFLNEITLGLVNFPHGFDQSLRSVLYRMTQTDPARRLTAVECLEIEPFASADIKAALLLPPKRKVTAPTLRPSRIAPMNPLTRFTRSASVKRVSDSFKKTDRPISHTFDSDPG